MGSFGLGRIEFMEVGAGAEVTDFSVPKKAESKMGSGKEPTLPSKSLLPNAPHAEEQCENTRPWGNLITWLTTLLKQCTWKLTAAFLMVISGSGTGNTYLT